MCEVGENLLELRPALVAAYFRAIPALAVEIGAFAAEETVMGALDHIEPGVWLGVFQPL